MKEGVRTLLKVDVMLSLIGGLQLCFQQQPFLRALIKKRKLSVPIARGNASF